MINRGLMFAWFRRIRRINIFGFELEFNHPPEVVVVDTPAHPPEVDPRQKGKKTPPKKTKTMPPGARFTVYGMVIRTAGNDLGIRARNEAELREFWRVN